MKKHLWKLMVIFLVAGMLTSCTKSSPTPVNNNSGNNGNGGSLPAYTFSAPQLFTNETPIFITPFSVRSAPFPQLSSIQGSIILKGVSVRSTSIPSLPYDDINYSVFNNGYTTNTDFPQVKGFPINYNYTTAELYDYINCFTIDSNGANVYAESDNKVLYKFNTSTHAYSIISTGLGIGACIKIVTSGETVMSTDSLNGALLLINDNGNKQVIASGLGHPGVFDVFNNDYYVVDDLQSGSVLKITPNGSVTSILTNLNWPANICFDNNGNFVLQTLKTMAITGPNMRVYAIYTADAKKITDLTDNNGNLIQSNFPGFIITPLFIDSNNNLFFSQLSGVLNPNVDPPAPADNPYGAGIYEMQLIKQ
ncbi:MAG TPA: hypothetical protein VGI43_13065 [Mucilaginibacter sp.]|jgi:hypothetical protein